MTKKRKEKRQPQEGNSIIIRIFAKNYQIWRVKREICFLRKLKDTKRRKLRRKRPKRTRGKRWSGKLRISCDSMFSTKRS